jgi:ADP-heptose:LPS heptosyltransferase
MNLNDKQKLDLFLGTILLTILRIPTLILGYLLKRDHSLTPQGEILIIKMQGGGSLVIAFPALLGIKKRYKDCRFILLTTRSVFPFAETLGIFDEIICVNDKNFLLLIFSSIRAWWKCLRVDTVIDLEVYSKLTTVFSILTAARNRIGFYFESTYWRQNLHTHLIFFNRFSGAYHFYDAIAKMLDAPVETLPICAEELRRNLTPSKKGSRVRISIGHACSEMGRERMLSNKQWLYVFKEKGVTFEEFIFLAIKADYTSAQEIIENVKPHFPNAVFENFCGKLSLKDSISLIDSSDEFWSIDSGLLHFAVLLGKKIVSFWGPTDPLTRLRIYPGVPSKAYYCKVPCSPCIHVAESPPCHGKNICIDSIFEKKNPDDESDIALTIADRFKTF